jgi:hypothetical protein
LNPLLVEFTSTGEKMLYLNGVAVMIGDHVSIGNNHKDFGVVVCVIDDNQFSSDYSQNEWSYLKNGVLIEFTKAGLVYFEKFDQEIEFIKRKI